ncbi:beta-glucan synthesis-associated protein [Thraustotheca clavata]|uniref:Beta-glucan synthesis-associated protein n=1 Tax=Thraustotheca clavata TaxID=74557 RepID=A0A1V9YSM9_9STRA|nr:beta-glucan synthesis-associated protein [Thraustotheca clavata]
MQRAWTATSFLLIVSAGNQNDPTQPTKSGIGIWVDADTDKSFYTKVSSRGDIWHLVMSDEFEVEGRQFAYGQDHIWTALDIPDGVNRAMELYSSKNVYTKNGKFYNRVDEGPVNVSFWNSWSETPGYENKTMHYTAGMVQSWNKFCIQGGFVEVSAMLPGAINKESINPHILGYKWAPPPVNKITINDKDRIPDIRFYPTWPGLWLMGNLGRALFAASTNRMWPWTYNECDERYRTNQRISACDPNPGYGLNPYQGRGAPEIDILEGGGTAISSSIQIAPGMPDEYRRTKPILALESTDRVDAQGRHGAGHIFCYYDKNCLTPGANMADVSTAAFAGRGHKSWYQGLRYAANNRCNPDPKFVQKWESVYLAQNSTIIDNQFDILKISSGRDLHADLGLIDGKGPLHWGINYEGRCFPISNGYIGGFLCDPDNKNPNCIDPRKDGVPLTRQMETFAYQMDAISSNWDITFEHYKMFFNYQIEWVTGKDGYIRWTLDDAPIFEIPAYSLTNPPQGGKVTNPKKIMVEEPSYIIFNIAMASAWGAMPPNWEAGPCRGNATIPASALDRNISNNICDSFPMYMIIDHIRIWQDTSEGSNMSVGCDPASHPTKEFIKAHILNFTDANNLDVEVAGRNTCNVDDDCTIAGPTPTGRCVDRRCQCVSLWAGPRCTKYTPNLNSDTTKSSFGPDIVYPAIILSALVIIVTGTTVYRRRRHKEELEAAHAFAVMKSMKAAAEAAENEDFTEDDGATSNNRRYYAPSAQPRTLG